MENIFNSNTPYTVLAVALAIWAGISAYLLILNKKIDKLEKQIGSKSDEN
jgi:CcmD family protein